MKVYLYLCDIRANVPHIKGTQLILPICINLVHHYTNIYVHCTCICVLKRSITLDIYRQRGREGGRGERDRTWMKINWQENWKHKIVDINQPIRTAVMNALLLVPMIEKKTIQDEINRYIWQAIFVCL